MTLTLTKKETFLGWLFLLGQFLVVPFAVTLVCLGMGIESEAAANIICFLVNAVLALIFFRRLLLQSLRTSSGHWKRTLRTALEGFGLYWLVNVAVTWAIMTFEPEFANINDQSIGSMLKETPLLMTLCVIFAAPLAEECLFRGWMFTGLAKRGLPLAYAVTCGFFSAAHILSYIGVYAPRTLFLCFVQYLGPSLVLCRTCHKDDSLCAPLLLHMCINAMGCLIME